MVFANNHDIHRLLSVVFLGSLLAGNVCGQSNFGSIRGQVTDVSGAAVANAVVKIHDTGTNATSELRASADGFFSAASLRPVLYEIFVEAPGFQKFTLT